MLQRTNILCANQLLTPVKLIITDLGLHVTVCKRGAGRPWWWLQGWWRDPSTRDCQAAPHTEESGKSQNRWWKKFGTPGTRWYGWQENGGKSKEWDDGKGSSEKERQSGKIAALRNIVLFMHCMVELPGEMLLLDRVRAPETNWEALNYPPQHREAMR